MTIKKEIDRIVFCPIGEGPHRAALREAVDFSKKSAGVAKIDMLAVVPEASTWDRLAHPDHVGEVITEQTAAWVSTLRRWKKEFNKVDRFEVTVGSTADSIVRYALQKEADLIVLSAGADEHAKAVVRKVFRTSECPVWLLRPTRAKTRRILATVNPEPDELDLNLAIIGESERLTKTLRGELFLMAAWELYGEQTMRRSAFLNTPIEHYHDLFDLREQITTRGLTELAEAAEPSVDYKIVVENGIAVPTILEAVRKRRANMLVIGTVGRAGLSGLLLGNTAEHLADTATCSVYAVKPPGFRSPLR